MDCRCLNLFLNLKCIPCKVSVPIGIVVLGASLSRYTSNLTQAAARTLVTRDCPFLACPSRWSLSGVDKRDKLKIESLEFSQKSPSLSGPPPSGQPRPGRGPGRYSSCHCLTSHSESCRITSPELNLVKLKLNPFTSPPFLAICLSNAIRTGKKRI